MPTLHIHTHCQVALDNAKLKLAHEYGCIKTRTDRGR